ncbi:MAG: hypothetical protein IJ461_10335 [Clostridia bacterium]|nr:hypothetical protein [Clostridia bacterium]
MVKGLVIAAAAGLFALLRLLAPNSWAAKGAAVILPGAAALLSASWEPLCLIPILSVGLWLNLPDKLRRQIPKEAKAQVGFVWPQNLTAGGPQVMGLCVPLQLEGADRRRGGDVLFNTALALCAPQTPEGEGLARYAAAQGFDRGRLTGRMPLIRQWEEAGLVFCQHQDRGAARTFVMGSPQAVLARCRWVLDGRERLMEAEELNRVLRADEQMRQGGLRVYAFAMEGAGGTTYLGMAGLAAAIRPEAFEQIQQLGHLGARPILLGQGSRESIWALACETGIIRPGDRLVMAEELERMDDSRLEEEVRAIGAFGNLTAKQRRRVANAWRQWGESVLPLGLDGLDTWENALKEGCRLEKAAAQIKKQEPLMIFGPCLMTLLGAVLNLWPISAASVLISSGMWIYQIVKHKYRLSIK